MGQVAGDGSRLMTGMKYFRITGKDVAKAPYQPGPARDKAWEHAGNFVFNRAKQVEHLGRVGGMPAPPIVVAPYDAELYGHWWFEGPAFLEAVFRRLHEANAGHAGHAGGGRSRGHHPSPVPRSPPRVRRSDPQRKHVGRGRIRRGVGRPRGGVDVATRSSRHAIRALAGPAAPLGERETRSSARSGDPRALAAAVGERLAVHSASRHRDTLCRGTNPSARAPLAASGSSRRDGSHRGNGFDLARRPVPARQFLRSTDGRRAACAVRLVLLCWVAGPH